MKTFLDIIFILVLIYSIYFDYKNYIKIRNILSEIEEDINYFNNEDEVNRLSFNAIFDRLEKLEENNLCQK